MMKILIGIGFKTQYAAYAWPGVNCRVYTKGEDETQDMGRKWKVKEQLMDLLRVKILPTRRFYLLTYFNVLVCKERMRKPVIKSLEPR